MPTIAELRSIIRGQLTGQIPVDDVRLRDRWINQVMHQQRSLLIAQYARGTGIPQSYYQSLDCIQVECGEVECVGIKSGVQYHYATIPTVSSIRDAVYYFGSVDGNISFVELSIAAFNANSTRFGRSNPGFTIIQNKALLKNMPAIGIKKMRLVAVLYDPAHGLCGQNADDFLYPIDDEDIGKLTLLCIKQISSTLNIPADVVNDSADQPVQVTGQRRQ